MKRLFGEVVVEDDSKMLARFRDVGLFQVFFYGLWLICCIFRRTGLFTADIILGLGSCARR